MISPREGARQLALARARQLDAAAAPQHQQRVLVGSRRPWCGRLRWRQSGPDSSPAASSRACCSTAWVSAAKPTTNGRGVLALTCARISGVRVSSSVERLAALLDLLLGARQRPIVGHRGGADEDRGARQLALHRGMHLLAALDIDAAHAGRSRRAHTGPLTSTTSAPASLHRLRDREAHLAGAAVAHEAHRVDALARRAGGDQHAPPLQRAPYGAAAARSCATISSGSSMRPGPVLAAGLIAHRRAEHAHAAAREQLRRSPGWRRCSTSDDSSPAPPRSARRSPGTACSADRRRDRAPGARGNRRSRARSAPARPSARARCGPSPPRRRRPTARCAPAGPRAPGTWSA